MQVQYWSKLTQSNAFVLHLGHCEHPTISARSLANVRFWQLSHPPHRSPESAVLLLCGH